MDFMQPETREEARALAKELDRNIEAANEILRQLLIYHRRRVARRDRFVLLCKKATEIR